MHDVCLQEGVCLIVAQWWYDLVAVECEHDSITTIHQVSCTSIVLLSCKESMLTLSIGGVCLIVAQWQSNLNATFNGNCIGIVLIPKFILHSNKCLLLCSHGNQLWNVLWRHSTTWRASHATMQIIESLISKPFQPATKPCAWLWLLNKLIKAVLN